MTKRPDFLKTVYLDGRKIVDAFRQLSKKEALAVDSWLNWAVAYGSMSFAERCLYEWINESWDLESAF